MDKQIKTSVRAGTLPPELSDLVLNLRDAEDLYVLQEGINWDFKESWPFSYSDEYFGGIARLICALANTHGGIIIFGVHDQKRTAGHNKVRPNLDRLEQALADVLSDQVRFQLRRYTPDTPDAVDVLLVLPISDGTMPVRFVRSIEKYREGIIWIREGHEVVSADSRHVPLLYCRGSPTGADSGDTGLSGGLPPSPATVKKFVGRLATIDKVFHWLKCVDEPRRFLYGKGGSGKTTIAYEVARALKLNGRDFRIEGVEPLDNVIFLSAKQTTLNTFEGRQEDFVGKEFETERELYETILAKGSWTAESLKEMSLSKLKLELKEFLDLTSNFIVIDDVDTLTTKGLEAGFDFLYGLLWRAKRKSKILYTLRNAPSQSLVNAIEVPGLATGGEYEEFISVCCAQFRVEAPTKIFRDQQLAAISERRPLVIESIIALRRNSGTYDRAVQLFEQNSGADVRRYVFQREWDALPTDNHARYVLAVIALNGRPVTFEDILALTRYEAGRVKDALGEVREMFLTVIDAGAETTYQMGVLTTAFVSEEARKLDRYSAIRARVEQYNRHVYPQNPILTRLRDRVEGLLEKGQMYGDAEFIRQAWTVVADPTVSPKIAEDPRFLSLQGYVAAKQKPPKYDDARRYFEDAFSMHYEPEVEILKAWFFAARDSGRGINECVRVADFVASGKRYVEGEKLYFLARKATCLFNRARADLYTTPEHAIGDLIEALRIHLLCFEKHSTSRDYEAGKAEEYARNTAFLLFDFLVNSNAGAQILKTITHLNSFKPLFFDVIELPLIRAFELLSRMTGARPQLQIIRNLVLDTRRELDDRSAWHDASTKSRVLESATRFAKSLAERIRPS